MQDSLCIHDIMLDNLVSIALKVEQEKQVLLLCILFLLDMQYGKRIEYYRLIAVNECFNILSISVYVFLSIKSLTICTLCDMPGPISFCCPRVRTIIPRFVSDLMSRLTVLTLQFKSLNATSSWCLCDILITCFVCNSGKSYLTKCSKPIFTSDLFIFFSSIKCYYRCFHFTFS